MLQLLVIRKLPLAQNISGKKMATLSAQEVGALFFQVDICLSTQYQEKILATLLALLKIG